MKLTPPKRTLNPSTTLTPLMEALVTAHTALLQFQATHQKVFADYDVLREAVDVAQNELKTASKRIGAGYETDRVSCEYVMPHKEWYDADYLRTHVAKDILDSLKVITMEPKVDVTILKALVRAKRIKKSVMHGALRREPTGSPRVTITLKPEDE
jgi:hypothetical protein